jgi:NAD(P)-dependent dehydrogenase (short-subunit alcohol dehydrogenase family)
MNRTPDRGTVLITGASSGIGRATALLLDRIGYGVFAGVRKPHDAERLRGEASVRLCPLTLDITEQAEIAAAAEFVRDRLGPDQGLRGLVNNAGSVEAGPIECIALERLRHQMEVNLIGHVAVIQAFLPMIRRGHGRVINVSSAIADCPTPFLGAYAASKCALRGMSLALRRELRWWGIPVSIIEAGVIDSAIWGHAERLLETIRREDKDDRYGELLEVFYGFLESALRIAAPPDVVAATIKTALEARHPRALYRSGPGARFAWIGNRLPEALVHRIQAHFLERHRRRKRGQAAGRARG